MIVKWLRQAAVVLLLLAFLPATVNFAQDNSAAGDASAPGSDWLLHTLKDSLTAADGDTLVFRHTFGDVRIEASNTDRIQVTAIAQYHADDPRIAKIQFIPCESDDGNAQHQLKVEFPHLEIAENEAWKKRRIDVGLFIPEGLQLEIETTSGLIETKTLKAKTTLISQTGDIEYKGTADIKAHTERGNIIAHIRQTGPDHSVELSTLTGDIRSIFLQDANAQIDLSTRGPITTDYSIDIDREAGAALKTGKVQIGEGGSRVKLESNNGGIRVQGLIVSEEHSAS